MTFHRFREIVQSKVTELLSQETLFVTDVDKEKIWELYLSSFPAGTNNKYIERTEHDCSACRQFIKTFGGVVAISDREIISVWEVEGLDSTYAPVANALSNYVKSRPIADRFMHSEAKISISSNVVQLANGEVHTWTHLSAKLPERFVVPKGTSIGAAISETRDIKNVFKRSLDELSIESIETVLDLISQNSLYRGTEFKPVLDRFLEVIKEYALLPNGKDEFCWELSKVLPQSVTKIRNSAIGTLLIDLSEGMELDTAVRRYEAVVAPANYKRPKAIFSKRMLEEAQKTVTELGLSDSLGRRFATIEDIRIQNILFANSDTMRQVASTDVFAQMAKAIPTNVRKFQNVEEVTINKFVDEILPRVTNLEIFLEGRHSGNLVSVIAPSNSTAPSLFKWDNGFSWAYSGNITDSMKQRVKDAGGNVEGVLRFSIQWNEDGKNHNDFDAHCHEPNGNHIYFGNKGHWHSSSGMLDVDIINPSGDIAVENIIYTNSRLMPEGVYQLSVKTYCDRGGTGGFRAEIELEGEIYSFDYPHLTRTGEIVKVAEVSYSHREGFKITRKIEGEVSSKALWNKQTNQFHPVTAMMLSPNYWDQQTGNGNKHFLFLMDECINDESPNGFFNEFLKNDLMPHRKVFEALGAQMKVTSDNPKQLSGVGFSSTQKNSVVAKISGHVDRVVKITF